MRTRYTPAELRTARLWWIVSLDFGGRTWRVSQGSLSIESTELNRWISVSAGLEGAETEMTAPWMGTEPESRRASVTLSIPELDVGLLLGRGYEMDGQPLRIDLWREGDNWDDRLQVLAGTVASYEWGAKGEVLTIEAEELAYQDRALLPPPGAVVSAATWPSALEDQLGAAYPWIFGAPGSDGSAAAPAIYVVDSRVGVRLLLLVAGHPVTAVSVRVFDGTTYESFPIEHINDGLGRNVAVVDLAGATLIAVDPSLTYSTAWLARGGLIGCNGGDATGAGSVIEAVLALSTLPIDRGSLAAVRSLLDAYKIGAYVEEPISPMEWVLDALIPLLPVAILTGPSGWRLVPVPVEPTDVRTIGTLTASAAIRRDGPVRTVGRDEVANRVELRYAISQEAGDPSATAVAGYNWDGSEHPALLSRLSAQVYGRKLRSDETVAVYDAGTALRIVRNRAAMYAFPRQVVTYVGQRLQWLQPGDIVQLEDSELHLSRVAWVERITLTPDSASVDLVLWRAL